MEDRRTGNGLDGIASFSTPTDSGMKKKGHRESLFRNFVV